MPIMSKALGLPLYFLRPKLDSADSLWMQLMQPCVQKWTITTLPF